MTLIVATTDKIEGREIYSYLGIVAGEAIVGAHLFKDLFASIRDIVGGRARAYEDTVSKAREIAQKEMEEKAQRLGASAIIGIDFDYEVIGKSGSMLMVSATGTAVKLK